MRFYNVGNNKKYPSVTTILSNTKSDKTEKSLSNWKKRIGEDKAKLTFDNACLRGTATHSLCEAYLKGEPLDLTYEPVIPYWESIKPVLSEITYYDYLEQPVHNDKYRYAGTLDCYGTFRGIPNTLIDFKTSDKPKKVEYITDYFLQTVAYSAAVKNIFGVDTNQAAVIIGLPNKKAQVFVLDRITMLQYWPLWLDRVNRFYNRYQDLDAS
jgi:genome maintenance exonuclease 1